CLHWNQKSNRYGTVDSGRSWLGAEHSCYGCCAVVVSSKQGTSTASGTWADTNVQISFMQFGMLRIIYVNESIFSVGFGARGGIVGGRGQGTRRARSAPRTDHGAAGEPPNRLRQCARASTRGHGTAHHARPNR